MNGKRADSIVKNMLLHSRDGTGEHRFVGINALVEESLNLAYHGASPPKPNFQRVLCFGETQPAGERFGLYAGPYDEHERLGFLRGNLHTGQWRRDH